MCVCVSDRERGIDHSRTRVKCILYTDLSNNIAGLFIFRRSGGTGLSWALRQAYVYMYVCVHIHTRNLLYCAYEMNNYNIRISTTCEHTYLKCVRPPGGLFIEHVKKISSMLLGTCHILEGREGMDEAVHV